MSQSFFEQLQQTTQDSGPLEAARMVAEKMRLAGRYPELFEALKMQHRIELGLPAVHTTNLSTGMPDEIPDNIQDQLDKKLIEACREVGTALMKQGKLQEGWMYMRAVGDRKATSDAMRDVSVTQDNLDTFLGLLVHEGVDVRWGTELSLSMRGTCNTITMLDSVVSMHGRGDQQAAVEALVQHVHKEVLNSLKSDLERRESWPPDHPERQLDSLEALLQSRPNLLRDGAYHLDTTHLASTVRFAKILDNREALMLALDLANYGKRLHPQYQYASDEPFSDLYPMSIAFFRALLGEHTDVATKLFLQKAESLDPEEHGTIAIETYADLLARVGRTQEAMKFLIKRMPRGMRPFGVAPSLIDLAAHSGDFETMMKHSQERFDEIGFAAALLLQRTKSQT